MYLTSIDIDAQVANGEDAALIGGWLVLAHGIGGVLLAAPELRTDARTQLFPTEGLGDVVVGADLKPHHLVGLLAARRQHQDRHARRLGPGTQLAADIEAIE